MFQMKNITVASNSEKSGESGGRKWIRHGYKFMGNDDWFNYLVKPGTPLYPKGSVFKLLEFEDDSKYGNVIKNIVLGSVPSSGSESDNGKREWKPNPKDHPIWMVIAYVKDLAVAKIEKMSAKDAANLDLVRLSDRISDAAYNLYVQTRESLQTGKLAPNRNLDPEPNPEPKQEPDFVPPDDSEPKLNEDNDPEFQEPYDNIPF